MLHTATYTSVSSSIHDPLPRYPACLSSLSYHTYVVQPEKNTFCSPLRPFCCVHATLQSNTQRTAAPLFLFFPYLSKLAPTQVLLFHFLDLALSLSFSPSPCARNILFLSCEAFLNDARQFGHSSYNIIASSHRTTSQDLKTEFGSVPLSKRKKNSLVCAYDCQPLRPHHPNGELPYLPNYPSFTSAKGDTAPGNSPAATKTTKLAGLKSLLDQIPRSHRLHAILGGRSFNSVHIFYLALPVFAWWGEKSYISVDCWKTQIQLTARLRCWRLR